MKNDAIETGKMFFKMPLERMLQLVDELDALDEHIFMNSEMCSANWFSSLQRRESRCNLMMFRLEFELGGGAPLKDGTTASNAEVAKDLFERGYISKERYEIAQRGERSKDYDLALARREQDRQELESDLKRHRDNGWDIHADGSVSVVTPKSMYH